MKKKNTSKKKLATRSSLLTTSAVMLSSCYGLLYREVEVTGIAYCQLTDN